MQMRVASAISTGLHAAVLLWALVSFSGKTFEVTPAESLPVDLVSEKDFSQMTQGVKKAPKLETPKPLVEKIAEAKPVEDLAPKITEKTEVKATAEKTPEPQPMPKPDPIAEKLKKQDEQKEAKTQPQPLPPKKPVRQQPKFDADKIAALLDKREPQRNAAAGADLNAQRSLGTARGTAAQLSQSEIDALRARLMSLWNPPVGAQDAEQFQVTHPDQVQTRRHARNGPAGSDQRQRRPVQRDPRQRRARGADRPALHMLRPEHYDTWKEMDFTFDTKEMFNNMPVR